MKKVTVGVFASRKDAEKAINDVHNKLKVDTEDISYVYRNTQGEVKEVDSDDVSSDTAGEGAKKGAVIGGTVGALAGIAAVTGLIPGIGPLIAGGIFASLLGVTSAVGTAAVGAAAGAASGGIIGALVNLGVGKERAQEYSDRVNAGEVLVTVHSEEDAEVAQLLEEVGAEDVEVFKPSV